MSPVFTTPVFLILGGIDLSAYQRKLVPPFGLAAIEALLVGILGVVLLASAKMELNKQRDSALLPLRQEIVATIGKIAESKSAAEQDHR